MKKTLILGGTGFVGRILTENLIKEGNPPVLFNRGKRNAGIFPELRKFTGDRLTEDINQIAGESWDLVIDFSCMMPDNLEYIINILKGKASRYIFISTGSVYPMDNPAEWLKPKKEDALTLPCTPEERKDPDIMATYGQKKAECERVLLAADWLDSIIFRPALIFGRYDPTDRFYYWLYKVHSQDKILMPDQGKDRCTNTYSEDFAELIRKSIDAENHNKVYNASTHDEVSLKHYIDTASELLGRHPELINASPEFLEENKVNPWGDLPLWLGGSNLILDNSKAIRDFGVKFHSFTNSVKGCIDYYSSLGWPEPKYGISKEKEKELLKKLQ
jgi:2'-hydroxyisoflavone reductase